jgi:alkylation response protein AidB-like acyl-CoA dehydrogenase
MNEEEHKLGIRASSTSSFLQRNKSSENMLSDRGNGFKIAMNALNVGRIKLVLLVLTRNVELLLCSKQTKEYNLTRQ